MNFFEDKNLDCLVLVNPDNPTGNYISREGMLKLARWTKEKDIRFLADESFVDFAEETEPTLLVEELLDENPHMIVVKSISKSYGIPGLRLGVAASGDTDLIGQLKKMLPSGISIPLVSFICRSKKNTEKTMPLL